MPTIVPSASTPTLDLHRQALKVTQLIQQGHSMLGMEADCVGSTTILLSVGAPAEGGSVVRVYPAGHTVQSRCATALDWHRSHYPHRYRTDAERRERAAQESARRTELWNG